MGVASHGSYTPTSPRAVLHHTDANLCTILHTTVPRYYLKGLNLIVNQIFLHDAFS